MLKKLMKYELKNLFRFLSVFYILGLFFAALARVFGTFEDSPVFLFFRGFLNGAAISMMCSILINCFMRSWVRFRASLYGDESYLMHTLPVKRGVHYDSKFLVSFFGMLASFGAIILILFVAYYSKETMDVLRGVLFLLETMFDVEGWVAVAVFLLVLFVEFINGIQCGFFGIIMGHRENKNKILFSVIYGVAAYLVTQFLTLLVMFLFGLVNQDVMKLFTDSSFGPDTARCLVFVGGGLYLFYTFALYFINRALLSKGVNVD